jgi:hypothetical protein
MKRCKSCGSESAETATHCQACGCELGADKPAAEPATAWERIAGLRHRVEAQWVDEELNRRAIPHVIVSHHDSAFDGLFQTTYGWGHLEAPAEHADAIRALLEDLRRADGAEPAQ